ncbi:RraA family protein [Cytobacillus sp. FJAT-53684]|uniref:Putative 4-hydroxy-4-methyl-2-oxoglutarate aldolase n=1 Tax=Cytobacillus mangrovibacter TaxID=3299024 RepID=A0ABW6K542_9BACI
MKVMPRKKRELTEDIKNRLLKIDPATIGHWLQFGFMNSRIKAMVNNIKVVGSAFTVKTTSIDSVMVHKAVSLAREGDILVIDRNGDEKYACVGEIIVYAAKKRNLAGIIVDGPITDIQSVRELNFPVYSTGLSPVTTRLVGNTGEINTTIQCGGVTVEPGDTILGDDNGLLVLSKDLNIQEWLLKAEEKEAMEKIMKDKIDQGLPLASITKADQLLRESGITFE